MMSHDVFLAEENNDTYRVQHLSADRYPLIVYKCTGVVCLALAGFLDVVEGRCFHGKMLTEEALGIPTYR